MRRIVLTIILTILTASVVFMPLLANHNVDKVSAAGGVTEDDNDGGITQDEDDGGITEDDDGGGITTDTACPPDKLCNPLLSKYNTLCKVLQGIIDLITQIGAIIAVILIIWTGFKFITAQGNPSKLTAAKNAFLTTIIGTAVLLGASAIAQIVVKTVFTITNKNNPGVCSL